MKFKSLILTLAAAPIAFAGNPDAFAPIGVMGDHLHEKGKLMASYRYMFMRMEQNYDGTSVVSDRSIVAPGSQFAVIPTDMDMQMQMLGLMYSPTDRFTVMAMVNMVELSMHHVRRDGLRFQTKSSGIGDSSISGLFRVNDQIHVGLGLLLPTAETDKEDAIPGPGKTRLPYPMQLGAGSWGLKPSITWKQYHDEWSFGTQASAQIYLDDNDEGYQLGDRYEVTAWLSRRVSENISISLRTTFSDWGNIDGQDRDLLPLPVPTARPDLRGGSKLDLSLGVNFHIPNTTLDAGVELGKTVWQDLDGPQLGSDYWVTAGLRYSF